MWSLIVWSYSNLLIFRIWDLVSPLPSLVLINPLLLFLEKKCEVFTPSVLNPNVFKNIVLQTTFLVPWGCNCNVYTYVSFLLVEDEWSALSIWVKYASRNNRLSDKPIELNALNINSLCCEEIVSKHFFLQLFGQYRFN